MRFTESTIAGAFAVESDVYPDDRGEFVRAWVGDEFAAHGLDTRIAQCAMAATRRRGTIRGMHLQIAPAAQVKVVRVTRGAVFDVVVDLRPDSPTFRQWAGLELSAANRRVLYVPAGLAHGYQTLADDTDVLYFTSTPYSPAHERGVRWNDPAFGIRWPIDPPSVVSGRDASYEDYSPATFGT